MRFSCVVFSALARAVLFGPPAARAWTIDSQSGNNKDGTARFADPDQDVDKLTDPGASNSAVPTVSFGVRQTDSLYSRTDPFGSTRMDPPPALRGDDSHL